MTIYRMAGEGKYVFLTEEGGEYFHDGWPLHKDRAEKMIADGDFVPITAAGYNAAIDEMIAKAEKEGAAIAYMPIRGI